MSLPDTSVDPRPAIIAKVESMVRSNSKARRRTLANEIAALVATPADEPSDQPPDAYERSFDE